MLIVGIMRHLGLDKGIKMAEDESWLDSEIQKELDAINSAELEAPEDTEEPFIEDYEDVSSEVLLFVTLV